MGLGRLRIGITDHAYEQYNSRVGQRSRAEIQQEAEHELQSGNYYRKAEFIRLDETWWVFRIDGDEMIMLTCYGNTTHDVPSAKRWAKQHHDRIDLTGGEVLCDGEGQIS